MDRLSEDHTQALLSKQWLVKNDGSRSLYLMKFVLHGQGRQASAILIATDTKNTWYEVLPFKRVLNRWLQANPSLDSSTSLSILEKLDAAHSPSGFSDADFTIEQSDDYACGPLLDLTFGFNFDLEWFWRWNLVLLGPHWSSHLLSSQLILPLILTNHQAIQTASAQASFNPQSWKKDVDAIANHAKRALVHQVKGAATKPLFSETLQRMTSTMHGLKLSERSAPLEKVDQLKPLSRPTPPTSVVKPSSQAPSERKGSLPLIRNSQSNNEIPDMPMKLDSQLPDNGVAPPSKPLAANEESVTESDDDVPILAQFSRTVEPKPSSGLSSESESARPAKRTKLEPKQEAFSSTEESDDEPERSTVVAAKKRAPVRQPVKRGGKKW